MVGQRPVSIFDLDSRRVDILETCLVNACCDAVDAVMVLPANRCCIMTRHVLLRCV